jgi:hypothetical protein
MGRSGMAGDLHGAQFKREKTTVVMGGEVNGV